MKPLIQFKPTIPLLLIALLLVCFGLAPMAQAVGPDTDGTIPGSNNGEGIGVLVNRTTGIWNTGTGFEALNHLTAGNQNTATGLRALTSDTNGGFNTATGVYSLFSNTSGFFNSATGAYALANNISGNYNTANGYAALYRNTADYNTANGFGALYKNTTGAFNTAIGDRVLFNNTTGDHNAAVGAGGLPGPALFSNTIGRFNTAVGEGTLFSNTEGNDNTANGAGALAGNTEGSENVAVGLNALASNNTGNNNVALGNLAGFSQTTGSNNVYIGYQIEGTAGESNACYIASIFNQTSSGGSAVYVDANSKLGTITSSKRFKEEIKPMNKTSDALFALKPVSFRYKKEIDPAGKSQFGLVAEEVEKVNPDLVVRDKEGRPYSVRYDQVNAMLLNEFLKEHRKFEEQAATITELKSTVAQQQKSFQSKLAEQETQIEALASGLRKVTAQVEMSQPAQKVVMSKQ
jgi:hypothetical protein